MKGSIRHCDPSLILLAFIATPLFAQQAPSSRPSGPSEQTVKKARAGGLKVEVHNGATVFCWQDANTGSHLVTKKCVDESLLDLILERRREMRDTLRQGGTSRN
jgi:hypothetical protein